MQKYPFKNLVFKGGGMKALAYHGVLKVLESEQILPQIECVAGTSAGSLLATLLCFRTSVDQVIEIYKTVDYEKITRSRNEIIPDKQKTSRLKLNLEINRLLGGVDSIQRFVGNYGWYSNEYPYQWLQEVIANYCSGNGRATFRQFHQAGYRELYIAATNITRHQVTIFSNDTTPEVSVADAVLMSSSIPFLFEAIRFDGKEIGAGDYYADGGLLFNYPLHIFDDQKFEKSNKNYVYGVNWETLGCRLYTPENNPRSNEPSTGLFNYMENVLETIAEAQDTMIKSSMVDQLRTIDVSNCGVSPIDMTIKPDLQDDRYKELIAVGESSTREYLENYKLPPDRFYELKAHFSEMFDDWQTALQRLDPRH
jgi:NTE family protein